MDVQEIADVSCLPNRMPGAALVEAELRLSGELAVLAGHLNVVHAKVVQVVLEALRTGAWAGYGIASPDRWVAWKTGVSASHARALVDIAKRVQELPVTFAAFANGELTVDQAALIFRRVPAHNDAEIAGLARNATVEQLRRVVYRYPFKHPARATNDDTAGGADDAGGPQADADADDDQTTDTGSGGGAECGCRCHGDAAAVVPLKTFPGWGDAYDTPEPCDADRVCSCAGHDADTETGRGEPAAGRLVGPGDVPDDEQAREAVGVAMAAGRVSHGFDANGRFYLHADLPADEGAIVAQALAEAKDRLFRERTDVTWVDALVDVAERSLAAVESPDRRDRYRTYVMLDTDGAWIVGGPAIPQPLFDKLTCDGELRPVWTEGGIPVNVGRAHREPSEHVRRLIRHRDKTCRFPGCTRTRGLEIHHAVHWSQDGATDTANLSCLCVGTSGHHDKVHRGEITVEGNADHPDGLVFRDRHGTRITARHAPIPPGTSPPPGPPPGHAYQAPFGDSLLLDHIAFRDPPDQTAA